MFILSIDIGIKHLAHCLLNIEDKTVTIVDWEVINLTKEAALCHKCGKKATFSCPEGTYCKTHTRKLPYFLTIKESPLEKLSKKSLPELIALMDIYQKSKSWAKIDVDKTNKTRILKDLKVFKDTKMWKPIKKANSKEYDLVTLGKTIQQKYDERFKKWTIDTVLIENQLGNIAPKMKCIQGMVTQYFIMKGQQDIDFVSATNKLKRFIGKDSNYNERKKKGIEVTGKSLQLNQEMNSWELHFLTHKKKDDLADAFLQGIWYLEKNILNAEYLKL